MLRDPARRRYDCHVCGIHAPYAHARGDAVGAGAGACGDGVTDFDQRGLHSVVVEHARQRFLKGDHLGAVAGAYIGLEGMVRAKSGVSGCGAGLMTRAFGEGGILEAGPAGLAGVARDYRQRALGSMFAEMVSGVRNRICHEPEASLHIGREEALDILGTISYLCGQVEQARRRSEPGRHVPRGGGVRRSSSMPKSGGAQSVRKAGTRVVDADCHLPARGRRKYVPRGRTLLGLPRLQDVETLVRIAAGVAAVARTLAEIFR